MKMTVLGSWARVVKNFVGDGGGGEKEGLVVGALDELAEHEGGELVGLIVGGDADDGELVCGCEDERWR